MPVEHHGKRMVKNSLILYLRMFLTMGISLYSSRVVLNVLGIEDYGIYNVVGGVVAMFSFLNASMSSASARFLTMELGRNDGHGLDKMFSASITVHLIVAAIFFILAESIGLWFLEKKLVIPDGRMMIARVLYQLSVISVIRNITQVPYNSLIIAYERFGIYAYFEILNVLLKLGILFLLLFVHADKLLLYGILILGVSLLMAFIYRVYCKVYYPNAKFNICRDRKLLSEMLSFSGWDLYGNMSVTARTQGVNMLLNLFFGPILNAASGVASAVQTAVGSFTTNIMTAVKPQIFKRYASGNHKSAVELMFQYTKLSFVLLSVLSLPLLVKTEFVLKLWLKIIPDYAIPLCQLSLLFNLASGVSSSLMSVIHATGKIRKSSIINGSLYLAVIPITYLMFKQGNSPILPYVLNVVFVVIGFSLNSYYLKTYIENFSALKFLFQIFKLIISFGVVYLFLMSIKEWMDDGIMSLIVIVLSAVLLMPLFSFFIAFSTDERVKIYNLINQWKRR